MKILLVYPRCPDTFWGFRHALKLVRKKSVTPPLGLLTVASLLPADWDKHLIDMNVEELKDTDILSADLVFISAIRLQLESVQTVIRRCRNLGKTIVAGGPLFTTEPEKFPEVDYFILQEAELTLPRFLRDWELQRLERVYTTTEWADITQTPAPQWELIRPEHYFLMNIQYSRGCPCDCEFCDITRLYGRARRTKTAEQIIRELEKIYQAGWREQVLFVDDNFIGHIPRLKKELLPAILQWQAAKQYPFTFHTQVSINLADDPELMQQMVQAGFNTVFIGIETVHPASLLECDKLYNQNRDLLASVKKCQAAGLQVQGGFILGFDHDPDTVFDDQIEYIQASGVVTAMVGLLSPLVGTRLHQRLKTEGRLLGNSSGNNMEVKLFYQPQMDPAILLQGYQRVLTTIYSPARYYARVKGFLLAYNNTSPARARFRWRMLVIFMSVAWTVGILHKERGYFWNLVFWTLRHFPEKIRLAITLAVFGYHHRRIFDA